MNNLHNLRAEAIVYNLDGKQVTKYGKAAIVNATANSVSPCFSINFTTNNIVLGKAAIASSVSKDGDEATAVTDGNSGSRWSSNYTDNEWIYVDLGEEKEVASVVLNWESAYGKAYKLQLSDDAVNWKDVYKTDNGKEGIQLISFAPVKTRYIKMLGIKRATQWGYSLYEMEVYGKKLKSKSDLSDVHFIKLTLKDDKGNLLSDNFYWRGIKPADYTALNTMVRAKLKVTSVLNQKDGRAVIIATVTNIAANPAFAIHLQALRIADGERILPAIMSDNYFTLMKGESKQVNIEFNSSILPYGKYKLVVEPYNNK